jgi:hypothetical protein
MVAFAGTSRSSWTWPVETVLPAAGERVLELGQPHGAWRGVSHLNEHHLVARGIVNADHAQLG